MPFDLTHRNNTSPAGFVTVVAVLNPFSDDHRAEVKILAGQSLQEILETFSTDEALADHVSIFIEGHYIPPHLWPRVRPNPGATVFIKAVPGDPLSLIGAIAPVIGQGAVSLFFPGIAGTLIGNLVAAGIAFGVLAIGQALFGPTEPTRPRDEATFSITGARNSFRPFEAVPSILGTHRFVPPYGAAPYTEVVNNQQYLRFVVVWGYAPVSLSDLRIGNTPIEQYTEVEVEHDFTGTATELGLYPADVSQESLSILIDQTFQERRTTINCDEIGITVTFPNGMFRIDGDGNAATDVVIIEAQYRVVGGSTWTNFAVGYHDGSLTSGVAQSLDENGNPIPLILSQSYTAAQLATFAGLSDPDVRETAKITDNKRTAKRVSFRVTGLARAQYDVRVRRVDAMEQEINNKVGDRADWTALRSFDTASEPVQLAGVAKSAFRILASDQLNGVVDQLNGVVSGLIPIWTGTSWDDTPGNEQASSNPAAIYRYILTGAANARPAAAANVDDAGLGAWYDDCVANGWAFDQPIDFRRPVRDLMKDVASAGHASPTYLDDKWSVVVDKVRTSLIQHFSPRNTRNFQGALLYPEIPEALRIRFFNANEDYREDERIVYDDGFDETNTTLFQIIDLPGQTDPDNVYRLGRHWLAAIRLRPELFTFEIDIEHLVATRGDLCRLTHDAAIIGQTSGRISALGADITLDEAVSLVSGTSYTLRVRTSSGGSETFTFTASTTETTNTIPVTPSGIAVGDLALFGLSSNESIEVLISGIEYLNELDARVTCVPYSPELYSAADSIPPYTSNLSDPRSASFEGPPPPVITDIITDEDALVRTTSGDLEPRILIAARPGTNTAVGEGLVTRTASLQARYRRNGIEEPYVYTAVLDADTDLIELREVETGTGYDIAVRAIGPSGETSTWTTETGVQVLGASGAPAAVTAFGLNTIGDHTYVEWTYDPPVDVIAYELRYHPDTGITDWSRMFTLTTEIPAAARAYTVPTRSGSYAIKPIDILGNRAETALYTDATLENPLAINSLAVISEDPSFTGTKSGLAVTGSNLELAPTAVMADWTTLAGQTVLSDGSDGFQTSGTYEFGETDLGIVTTSRVFVDIDMTINEALNTLDTWATLVDVATLAGDGLPDAVRASMEVAFSLDDVASSPTYGAWIRLSAVGDITARWIKFRLSLETDDPSISPSVSRLGIDIEAPDEIRTEAGISSGAGTHVVTFSPAFFGLTSITVTPRDLQTGDYYEITGETRTGFSITFRNSSGTAVSRTFDYQALGYGRERGT